MGCGWGGAGVAGAWCSGEGWARVGWRWGGVGIGGYELGIGWDEVVGWDVEQWGGVGGEMG